MVFYFLHFYLMCTVLGRCVLPKKVVLQTTFFSLCWLKFMLLFFFLICKLIEFFHLKTLPSHLETRDDILIHKWLSGMGYLEQSSLIIIIWNIFQRDLELSIKNRVSRVPVHVCTSWIDGWFEWLQCCLTLSRTGRGLMIENIFNPKISWYIFYCVRSF